MFTFPVCGPMNSPFSQLFCASSTNWRRIRVVAVFHAAGHGTAGKAPSTGRVRLIGSGADRQSDDWRRRARFSPVLLVVGVCGSASQLCSARHVRRLAAWRRLHKVCGCWGMDGDRVFRRRALQNLFPLVLCAAVRRKVLLLPACEQGCCRGRSIARCPLKDVCEHLHPSGS
jgi:hypothetical protein